MTIASASFPHKEVEERLKIAKDVLQEIADDLLYAQKTDAFLQNTNKNNLFHNLRSQNRNRMQTSLQKHFPYDQYKNIDDHSSFIAIPSKTNFTWYLEPLEGIKNYVYRIPHSCLGLGLYYEDKEAGTLIYDFNAKEMYHAIYGNGLIRTTN